MVIWITIEFIYLKDPPLICNVYMLRLDIEYAFI